MSEAISWPWAALFALGAYHGVNPGMGWLFAVALGMQERSSRAVWRALGPISIGHALAIGVVIGLAGLIEAVLPLNIIKLLVAGGLFVFGLYHLVRHRHPRWGGMQVGFGDLTIWSFLMASAHGAGLMILPLLFGIAGRESGAGSHTSMHHLHMSLSSGAWTGFLVTTVHTVGYLLVTGLIAWIVYRKLGLTLLRRAWFNLDLIWAVALMMTGCFVFFIG